MPATHDGRAKHAQLPPSGRQCINTDKTTVLETPRFQETRRNLHPLGLKPRDLKLAQADAQTPILLRPARVFDGTESHEGWVVLVRGQKIEAPGPSSQV